MSAPKTVLKVDESTTLVTENCDGLTAEYSVPGIISYSNGKVTAWSSGVVTLILTQPETETIEGKVFEIEFTVNRCDVEWVWNAEESYYVNTTVENAFQFKFGDTSLLTITSSDENVAKVENGTLIVGSEPGIATITISYSENAKWNAREEQYDVRVIAQGHVPFDLTQELYNTLKGATQGSQGWDDSGGFRLGKSSEIFSWGDKYCVMSVSGIPDKLSFTYQSSSGASSRKYVIYESADGANFTEIWRDNRGSGVDGNSYQSGDIQLRPDTRFIKFFYYGNCAAYYRNVKVTELVKFASDTHDLHLNETTTTGSFTFIHANAKPGAITITAPRGIILSVPEMVGGPDVFMEQPINISYDIYECCVDDYIVISNGTQTETVHVIARCEAPDAISRVEERTAEETDVYTLSGQRLSKMQKGINIVGGKKVLK